MMEGVSPSGILVKVVILKPLRLLIFLWSAILSEEDVADTGQSGRKALEPGTHIRCFLVESTHDSFISPPRICVWPLT
jgi:hypothetical protein